MLKIPKEPVLPSDVLALLEEPGCVKVIGALDETGPSMSVNSTLTSLNGVTLVLSERLEKSPANKNLVRSIWQDRPVTVLLYREDQSYEIRCRVHRCLIVGEIFDAMLARAREKDGPDADITAAWELLPESWRDVSPQTLLEEQMSRYPHFDSHLDRASIRRAADA